MLLMRIPRRFWAVKYVQIEGKKLQSTVESYLRDIDSHLDAGNGLLFWGDNSLGKSSAAVILMKECRRRGAPSLFITAEDLRKADIERTLFHDDITVMDRAREVDVLVIDDLGKEHSGASGYSEMLYENLIRIRSAHQRTTIITSNLGPKQLIERYGISMMEVLRETVAPIHVEGENRRMGAGDDLRDRLAVG